MNAKNLAILLLTSALFAAGAYFVAFQQSPTPAPTMTAAGGRLTTAISERADDIAGIEITSGDDTTTLALDADGVWRVTSKAGYPAEADRVRRLITTLSELRTVEPKTAKPERHSRLALEWPDEPSGDPEEDDFSPRPTLVRVTDSSGSDIASIVLGDTSFAGGESRQYARLLDEDQTWLVSATANIPQGGMGWLDARFVELPRDSVKAVTISHPNDEVLRLTRDDAQGDFVVADIPADMAMTNQAFANNTGNALAFVNFTDVSDLKSVLDRNNREDQDSGGPIDDALALPLAEFTTLDGLTLQLTIQPDDAEGRVTGGWVWISMATGEKGDEISSRYGGYAFKLPAGAIESLTRRPSDLLEESVPDPATQPAGPELPGLPAPEGG